MGKGGMIGILNELSCHTPSDLGLGMPFMTKKKEENNSDGVRI